MPDAPFVCLQVSSVFWSLYLLRTSYLASERHAFFALHKPTEFKASTYMAQCKTLDSGAPHRLPSSSWRLVITILPIYYFVLTLVQRREAGRAMYICPIW